MMTGLVSALESAAPVAVVRLAGQLDLAAGVALRAGLQKALAEQPSGIVVDVSELTVDDDVTLTAFSAFAGAAAEWPGCPVVLCAPSTALGAALDRLTISRAVPVYPTRTQALAAIQAMPATRRYRRRLTATPGAAAIARQVVADACRAWHLPQLVDDAEIVVTELVANAVRHAGGDLYLQVALRERFLHLSLRDGSPILPVRVLPDPDTGHGGRGLILIDAIAANWGSTPTADGKVVWATLRLPARGGH
jgi:anti-anti-sigma regulatory factor/anti-sigma regulatory factor (Ser/Thr protein kinase)